MKIEKEQLKSLTLKAGKLTIEWTGRTDRTCINKATLIVEVENVELGEEFNYLWYYFYTQFSTVGILVLKVD